MVKRYVEEMKGHIYVDSEVGKGTCVTAILPFSISDHTDRDDVPARFTLEREVVIKPQENTECQLHIKLGFLFHSRSLSPLVITSENRSQLLAQQRGNYAFKYSCFESYLQRIRLFEIGKCFIDAGSHVLNIQSKIVTRRKTGRSTRTTLQSVMLKSTVKIVWEHLFGGGV